MQEMLERPSAAEVMFASSGWDHRPPLTRRELTQRYPAITGAERNGYLLIGRFFADQPKVDRALEALAAAVEPASPESLHRLLADFEKRAGFRPVRTIARSEGVLGPEPFRSYLRTAQPIHDLGAGSSHGFSTHRVQWWLIGRQFGDAIRGRSLISLYQGLGHPRAVGLENSSRGLWDDLFDGALHKNATFPEFIHAYRLGFPRLIHSWL